jgi:inosine/xanthosine triphosphatase
MSWNPSIFFFDLQVELGIKRKKMKTICIASTNPVKLNAAEAGFKAMFPGEDFSIKGVSVPVSVSAQPMSDAETLRGATERATNARSTAPDADYWVGIEGGVEDIDGEMNAFAWVVVLDNARMGKGRSGAFILPPKVAELVRQGVELGEADDQIFLRNNSKQQNGAIGLLTDDAVDRVQLYVPAVIFALIPFKNPSLYPV